MPNPSIERTSREKPREAAHFTRWVLKNMRTLAVIFLMVLSMSVIAGDFFPPEYKQFPFREGDLLVSRGGNGKFSVNKILKVDRMHIRKGEPINIQGQRFVATDDDYLLVVSAAYGADEFSSFEQARAAAMSGKWTVKLGHVPNRSPGAATGQTLVGHAPVLESELEGYEIWRRAFERGEAGVF